jgi:serine/threonine-protein kinase
MTDDDRIAELLIEWEEDHERGTDRPAEELCRDCPHLAPELVRRIHALKVTSWLAKADNNEPPSRPDDTPGPPDTPLAGRYQLDNKIAEGGFAEVWKGFDLKLRRAVAVKRPKPGRVVGERFVAEARRVAGLKHPGVVPVFDVGQDGKAYFIVSELVEGGSLADRIAENRPGTQEAVRIVAEVADTLAYAHGRGFVHKDIKPGNILIDHHGRALLTDFGIARSPGDGADANASFGTLAYMAPEQVEGKTTDHRADIYGLGAVLYELLTGQLPYTADDPVELRRRIVSGPPPVDPATTGVPVWLAGACCKCLARNPADRYQDAARLASDLRAAHGFHPRFRRRTFLVAGVAALIGAGVVSWRVWPKAVNTEPPVKSGERWERIGVIGKGVLQAPVGVAWDRDGNLLVTNGGLGRVSVLDRAGKLVREFGEPGRQVHQLRHPHHICTTSAGNIVVTDHGNDRVLIFRQDGSWLKSFGESGSELGQFHQPKGIACADHDSLYVVDNKNHRIQVFDAGGKPLKQFGKQGADPGQLQSPTGLALWQKKVYVSDTGNRRVQVFDQDGRFVRVLRDQKIEAQGLSVQPDGRLLVADTLNRCVSIFDNEGGYVGPLHEGDEDPFHPLGVATAPDGLVAVANYARHEVYLYRATTPSPAAH